MSKQNWKCPNCNFNCHRIDNKCRKCNSWRPEGGRTKNNFDNTTQTKGGTKQ